MFNAICRKSCQQIVIELNLIYHEGINFLLLWTTCPNPFSWAKKNFFSTGSRENYFGSNSQRIKQSQSTSQQQQQQHLFKHDKNYSGADVVVYFEVKTKFTSE